MSRIDRLSPSPAHVDAAPESSEAPAVAAVASREQPAPSTSDVRPWRDGGFGRGDETAGNGSDPGGRGGISAASLQTLGAGAFNADALIAQLKADTDSYWHLSSAEAGAFMDQFAALSTRDQGRVFDRLAEGKNRKALAALCETMTPEQRGQLLEAGVAAGRIPTVPGCEAPPLPLDPPGSPTMLHAPIELPSALQDAIHLENQARGASYRAQFSAYVDRYVDAVENAKSPLELRAVGPLLKNADVSDPDAPSGRQSFTGVDLGLRAASDAVSARISHFKKEMNAGTYGFTAKAGHKLEGGGFSHKRSVEVEVAPGYFEEKTKEQVGMSINLDPAGAAKLKASRSLDQNGKVKDKVELEVDDAKAEFTLKKGKLELNQVAWEKGGTGVELEKDGRTKLKVNHTFVELEPGSSEWRVGFEVKETVKLFGAEVTLEGELALKGKGVTKEYARAIGDPKNAGFFAPIPELDQGTSWQQLPADRQKALALHGWSKENWPHA